MKTRYIDTRTLAGIKQAERLVASYGWRAVNINPVTNIVTLTKE